MFCVGPLRHPWQNRKAGAQKQALPREQRYGCRPPTQNKSAPSSRLGTSDSEERGVIRRAEADLTGRRLAPPGPTVQALSRWAGAGPDGRWVGTAGSECPVVRQVG
ncbi:hypothetical protein GCM10010483_53660 [Actinokineospora diospyrosa]